MTDEEDKDLTEGEEESPQGAEIIDIKSRERSIKSKSRQHRGVMKEIMEGAQAKIDVKEELEEKLDKKGFFSRIFGEDSKITMFFTAIATKLGLGSKEDIDFKKFQKEIGAKDIETFVVSHRALGYGRHKENSRKSIEAALDGGERQIEIDLRWGDDEEIYLSHDTIEGVKKPADKFLPLSEALEVFAQHNTQDIAIFFDTKDPRVLDKLDSMIDAEDEKHKTDKDYMPIDEKHFVMGFNHEVIAKAYEKDPDRPLMFNYIPTVRLKDSVQEFSNYERADIENICEKVDSFAGTHLKNDLRTTNIFLHGRELKPTGEAPKVENIIHVVEDLPEIKIGDPPKDILDVVKYVCIPAPLATKTLVNKLRSRGVKVAVWGAEGAHIQKAIASIKADLVISDKPDVIEGD